jgi:hypoxanthine phosphoribosyltransferase
MYESFSRFYSSSGVHEEVEKYICPDCKRTRTIRHITGRRYYEDTIYEAGQIVLPDKIIESLSNPTE